MSIAGSRRVPHAFSVALLLLLVTTIFPAQSYAAQEDDDGPDLTFVRIGDDGWLYVDIEDMDSRRAAEQVLRVTNDVEYHAAMFDVDEAQIEVNDLSRTQLRRIDADEGFIVMLDETLGYYGCNVLVFSVKSLVYWVQHCGDDMSLRNLERFAADVVIDGLDVDPPRGYGL